MPSTNYFFLKLIIGAGIFKSNSISPLIYSKLEFINRRPYFNGNPDLPYFLSAPEKFNHLLAQHFSRTPTKRRVHGFIGDAVFLDKQFYLEYDLF
jgi:hypothetical protein